MAKPKVPAAIEKLLATHAKRKKPFIYKGSVSMFAADQEVTLDVKGATARIEDDETRRRAGDLAFGFFSGLVLVADTTKATLPVTVFLEGRPVKVAASFAAFAKNLGELEIIAAPKKGEKLLEPQTVEGEDLAWPKKTYAVVLQDKSWATSEGRNPFLWIELRGKNYELFHSHMKLGKSVAKLWQAKTEKFDRGTSDFLDVAWYRSSINLAVVTPRVKALMEQLPLNGVEFLPHRTSIGGNKGDYFVVHTLRWLDCLDVKASKLVYTGGEDTPSQFVFEKGAVPADAHLFRVKDHPQEMFASPALVDALRGHQLSGIDFMAIKDWRRELYR